MLKTATDPVDGPLKTDSRPSTLMQVDEPLTVADLTPGAARTSRTRCRHRRATNRDGTLRVDSTKLTKALADHPAQRSKRCSRTARGVRRAGRDRDRGDQFQLWPGRQRRSLRKGAGVGPRPAGGKGRPPPKRYAHAHDGAVRQHGCRSSPSYKSTQTFLQQQVDSSGTSSN
jgi:flagellar hook-associated protein 2